MHLLIDPTLSAAFITKVLGAILLITGAMQIAAACGMRGRDQWTLVLGGGIVTTDPRHSVFMMPGAAILVFAIFTGVQLLFLGHGAPRRRELRPVGRRPEHLLCSPSTPLGPGDRLPTEGLDVG